MAKNIETRESEAISLYTKDSLGVVRRVGEFSSDGSGLILGSAGAEGIPGLEQYNIKLHRGGNGVLQLILANDTTPEGVLAPNSSLATVFLTASGFSNTDRSFFVIDSMSGAQTSQAGSVNSVKAYVDAEKHIGEVRAFAMSTPPANWMVCNGATLSKTIYPELYGVIDVTYGGTLPGTTYNIPNYQGMFLRGLGGASNALGVPQLDQANTLQQFQTYHAGGTGANYGTVTVPLDGSWSDPLESGKDNGTLQYILFKLTGLETWPKNMSVLYCIRYQ